MIMSPANSRGEHRQPSYHPHHVTSKKDHEEELDARRHPPPVSTAASGAHVTVVRRSRKKVARYCAVRSLLLVSLAGMAFLRGVVWDVTTFTATTTRTTTSAMRAAGGGPPQFVVTTGVTTRSSSSSRSSSNDNPSGVFGTVLLPMTTNRTDVDVNDVEWLMGGQDFPIMDVYSAAWYVNIPTFLKVDTSPDSIYNQESAAFRVYQLVPPNELRMSMDYLDFSVEHLSKWWKNLRIPKHETSYRFAMDQYSSYIQRSVIHQKPFPYRRRSGRSAMTMTINADDSDKNHPNPLHPTVAIVAFSQYKEWYTTRWYSDLSSRVHNVTVATLGVTLASLVQLGVGRIVVAGSDPSDVDFVHESFRLLSSSQGDFVQRKGVVTHVVHDTHLVFALLPNEMVNASNHPNNVPRGTLMGLQHAFVGSNSTWTTHWLGDDPSYWKYVYYTEADQILQTRPSMLPHLQEQLDMGHLVNPHRLQLIGYQGDVPDLELVPTDFKTPIHLHSGDIVHFPHSEDGTTPPNPQLYQYCCGSPDGPTNRPVKTDHPIGCGTYWYDCGLRKGLNHTRLEKYDLIRLSDGSGITSLASTNQGRRCIPSTTPCRRDPLLKK